MAESGSETMEARGAGRRVGHPAAPYAALAVYLLHPVVGSIASYEFHPSALALFPRSC